MACFASRRSSRSGLATRRALKFYPFSSAHMSTRNARNCCWSSFMRLPATRLPCFTFGSSICKPSIKSISRLDLCPTGLVTRFFCNTRMCGVIWRVTHISQSTKTMRNISAIFITNMRVTVIVSHNPLYISQHFIRSSSKSSRAHVHTMCIVRLTAAVACSITTQTMRAMQRTTLSCLAISWSGTQNEALHWALSMDLVKTTKYRLM
mmetsp:Transcript_701/g.1331  ORF Transcript_701/g.1331 Transcript_701/m.1331 type:complete len:207 (+) Transcript_701:101-721(+)